MTTSDLNTRADSHGLGAARVLSRGSAGYLGTFHVMLLKRSTCR